MVRKTTESDTGTVEDVGSLKDQILDLKKQIITLTNGMESLQGEVKAQSVAGPLQNFADQQGIFFAQIETLSQKVSVLEAYIKNFNTYLCNSMISNNADKVAEDALTEVLSGLPD